jgi:hypothetical protein
MGVRKAKYRLEKWKVKTYDAKGKKLSPETEEKMRRAFAHQEKLENTIKQLLGKIGVPTWQNTSYLNVARKIDALKRHYSEDELKKQTDTIMAKGLEQKLDKTTLEKIKNRVLGPKF